MNDIRRTILWVVFGFSLVLLWDQWQVYNGRHATFFPNPAQQAAAPASRPAAGVDVPKVDGSVQTAAAQPGQAADIVPTTVPELPRERFEVTTDVLKLTFDTQGGSLVRTEFLKHADMADKSRNVVLFDDTQTHAYVAQTGLWLPGGQGGVVPTHKTVMKALPGGRSLGEGSNELLIRFESPEVGGMKLVKTYTVVRGSYVLAVRHEVVNTGATALAPQLYLRLVRDGSKPPGESAFYSTFTGPVVYTSAKKYQKVEFADIKKNKIDIEKESSDGYIAMVQHYFASAWMLPDGVKRSLSMSADVVPPVADCCYQVTMITPLDVIAPGGSKVVDARLFAGPQEEKLLESLAPGLELVKDYGWLTIIAKPLYWLLDQLHGILQNWGWSIVALVLLLKAAFYWLNAQAYASMAKMKAINPKLMELRERLKDKPQQMQQEMMRIYREEKVNPMGGCFPIMVQIPVFIALYWVLLSSIEMRNAPWVLWIKDLSSPDPLYILPLVMTATTLLQTALNPVPPDPIQAKMMWFMPLLFSVMFFFFPSGLVLYWITNNILSIVQQWIINVRMGVPPQFNLPKFN